MRLFSVVFKHRVAIAKHFISFRSLLLHTYSESLVFDASDIMVLVPIVVMTNNMKEFIPKQKLLVFGTSLISYESNKDEMDQILEMCAKLLWQLALT